MRIDLGEQGLVLEVSDKWSIAEGWNSPSLWSSHGIYLVCIPYGMQLHVRAMHQDERTLDEKTLRAMLSEQNWASRPFDDTVFLAHGNIVVAGTFAMEGQDEVVREFFITDGQCLGNAAMVGPPDKVAAAHSTVEQLLSRIQFRHTK